MGRWRLWSRVPLILMSAAGLIVASLGAAPSAVAQTVQYRQIINYDGKCLDMTGGSRSNGTQAQQWGCNGNSQQYWGYVPTNAGGYLIENYKSGKCLSILKNDPNPGGAVTQWTCDFSGSNAYELWYLGGIGNWTILYNIGTRNHRTCGSAVWECAMHPSGNGTSNGLKIYNNVCGASCNPTYGWRNGKFL
jgi:hypothetical protein